MEKAFEFLRKNKDVAFATIEHNKPKLRIFQVMLIDGHDLYFATSPKKEVYKQLQENPSVEILGLKDNISVRMAGTISFDVDIDKQKQVYNENRILQELYPSYDTMVYAKMKVEFIEYYDLNQRPPLIERFSFE